MAIQLVQGASQLINSSNAISIPIQVPGFPETSSFSVNVWIKADWGTTSALRGTRSFVGIYGPAAVTPGLVANYYSGTTFSGTPTLSRNETGPVSFNYPGPGGGPVTQTNWSVVYTGYFVPPSTGFYYFQTNSDDGVRVTINGNVVIDNLTDHAATIDTSTVALRQSLTANTPVTIEIKYYQGGGDAILDVRYGIGTNTTVAGTFTTIPASALKQTAATNGQINTALQIGTKTGGGEISVWTYGGSVLTTTATNFNPVANNTWINVCFTFDGLNNVIYINGVPVASDTTIQNPGTLKYVVINGYLAGAAGETDTHSVDCYMLYNRCLTLDEVGTIYQANGGRHGIWNGQVAYYEFDELAENTSVSKVLDLSGTGADLTVVGAAAAPKYIYSNTLADSNIRPPISP